MRISRSLKPVLFFAAQNSPTPLVRRRWTKQHTHDKQVMHDRVPPPRYGHSKTTKRFSVTKYKKTRKSFRWKLLNARGWIYQLEGINADSSHSTYTQACQYLPRICLKRKLPRPYGAGIDLHLPLFVLYIACPPRSRIRLSFPRNTARNLLQQFLTHLHIFL